MRNACKILVGNSQGKRPLGRPRRRWEDMRMNLKEIGWEVVDSIYLVQDRDRWLFLVNAVMKLQVS
jgi:hypothetical protein